MWKQPPKKRSIIDNYNLSGYECERLGTCSCRIAPTALHLMRWHRVNHWGVGLPATPDLCSSWLESGADVISRVIPVGPKRRRLGYEPRVGGDACGVQRSARPIRSATVSLPVQIEAAMPSVVSTGKAGRTRDNLQIGGKLDGGTVDQGRR